MTARDFKYGILLFVCFTVYFLIMSINDFYVNVNLRAGNVVFHAIVLYLAISRFRKSEAGKKSFDYITGFLAGFKPSIIGSVLFAIFQFFYLLLNEDFLLSLKAHTELSEYLTPLTGSIVILFEGIGVSLILSYILMRIVDHIYEDKYVPERDSSP